SASPSSTLSLHDALPISCSKKSKFWGFEYGGVLIPNRSFETAASRAQSRKQVKYSIKPSALYAGGGFPGMLGQERLISTRSGARSEEHTSELQSRENLVC